MSKSPFSRGLNVKKSIFKRAILKSGHFTRASKRRVATLLAADPPENCHLNVKKSIFKRGILKNGHFTRASKRCVATLLYIKGLVKRQQFSQSLYFTEEFCINKMAK